MIEKLSERDKRALKIGAVCVVGIVVFAFAAEWLGHWGQVRKSLATAKADLKAINPSKADQEGLRSIVPAFEMPQDEEEQKVLFRNKLNEQLKKARINSKPLQTLGTVKSRDTGYELLRLKCSGKARLAQVLDFLANLNENPYLVGIEEMQIKCDPKKRQEVELDLIVSTLTR